MLIVKTVTVLFFLVGLVMSIGSWIGFIIDSFKEREPGLGFFTLEFCALGGLLISSSWLIAQFVP